MTTRHMHYTCGCEYVGDLASRSCPYHPSHPAIESAPAEPTPEPPTESVDEKASKWLKATMLSKGRDEDTLPTAVDRAVRRVLGSCSGESLHRHLVRLVRELAPAGAPAPCVWRDVGDALFFISAPGCGTKHKHAWPYRSIVGWSHCPYCGHPLTVER